MPYQSATQSEKRQPLHRSYRARLHASGPLTSRDRNRKQIEQAPGRCLGNVNQNEMKGVEFETERQSPIWIGLFSGTTDF